MKIVVVVEMKGGADLDSGTTKALTDAIESVVGVATSGKAKAEVFIGNQETKKRKNSRSAKKTTRKKRSTTSKKKVKVIRKKPAVSSNKVA